MQALIIMMSQNRQAEKDRIMEKKDYKVNKKAKQDIEEIVAKIARIPSTQVSTDDRHALKNLDRDLKAVVFGQDPAVVDAVGVGDVVAD